MAGLICPACKQPLKHYVDNEEHAGVFACESCSGLWFDGHTLHDFMHSRRLKARFLVGDAEPLQTIGFTITTHPRTCPHCAKVLEEDVYGGIEVDVCRQCKGIWFDDGTLDRALKIHAEHKAHLDVLDEELKQPGLPHLPGPFDAEAGTNLVQHTLHEIADRVPSKVKSEVKHLFEAVAHLLHHDHPK